MLPLVAASIVLGSAKELLGINHVASFIDSFVSYCHHSSVETIQRFFFNVYLRYLWTKTSYFHVCPGY